MAINLETLVFEEVTLWGITYRVVKPQNSEEFIFALENDLLNIGPNTKVRSMDLFDEIELLLKLN